MRRILLPAGALAITIAAAAGAQTPKPASLPYAAVHDPQFVSAAEATFMGDDDRVIGLMSRKTAKAYPAAILSQHGLVQDMSPKGPIAVTW